PAPSEEPKTPGRPETAEGVKIDPSLMTGTAAADTDAAKAEDDGKTILIAEDDPFISRMYQIKLESAGFHVIVKNNGRDAFEAIKADQPNLAVLDINMPELSGLEVLAA